MRGVVVSLFVVLLMLQYALWVSDDGLPSLWRLEQAITAQRQANATLKERNAGLEAEVYDLKHGLDAVEERARSELGMIKKGETFYQVVEP